LQDTGGSAVVISGADVKLTAARIDCGGLPDRASAVTARHSAVVRRDVCFSENSARVRIERNHTATERAALIGRVSERQAFLDRGYADVNDIPEYHGGAGDRGSDLVVDSSYPVQTSGPAVDGDDVGAVMDPEAALNIADDEIAAMDGGTGARAGVRRES